MERLVLARHAESELSVRGVLNGDASVEVGLTERGRDEARALGRAAGPVDLVAHTEFGRTRETAELAWPEAPRLVVPELNEIRFGRFEGIAWADGYGAWASTSGPVDPCPGGGESRAEAIARFVRGYRKVLRRAEETVALVAHGAHIRYLLLAIDGSPPAPLLENVPPATAFRLSRDELAGAIGLLEEWGREPAWR